MSDNEDNQVHVKTGITVHQLSKISSHETSIKVNMEVYFTYDEDEVTTHLKGTDISIAVDLGVGRSRSRVWTCDLTHDYIRINADYRT